MNHHNQRMICIETNLQPLHQLCPLLISRDFEYQTGNAKIYQIRLNIVILKYLVYFYGCEF